MSQARALELLSMAADIPRACVQALKRAVDLLEDRLDRLGQASMHGGLEEHVNLQVTGLLHRECGVLGLHGVEAQDGGEQAPLLALARTLGGVPGGAFEKGDTRPMEAFQERNVLWSALVDKAMEDPA